MNKTGSLQIKNLRGTKRSRGKTRSLDYKDRDQPLFVLCSSRDPKYAISVVVEHGGSEVVLPQ